MIYNNIYFYIYIYLFLSTIQIVNVLNGYKKYLKYELFNDLFDFIYNYNDYFCINYLTYESFFKTSNIYNKSLKCTSLIIE